MRQKFYRARFILIPIGIAAFLSVVSFVVMSLWNYLLPGILHVGLITFWQAMGIFILCKILFGFGKGGGRPWGGGAPWAMRKRMMEKFKNMTPEEKERFRKKMHERCGGHHPFADRWEEFAGVARKTDE